jgi:predicted nucleic acid-binding protein
MAGHARYTALLDACVLYPMAMADALMSLATTGLFTAKWTSAIEDEWIGALETNRPDLRGRLGLRRDQMRIAVPDWEVPAAAWQRLAPCLSLPDPKDVHVLASAVAGHADCIVTSNLKHFPNEQTDPYGIEVVHPDAFVINQWDLDELVTVNAFKRMRARWKKPQATPEDFAQAMERGGLPATAARLRDAAEFI